MTKTSDTRFLSRRTMFEALDWNAINRAQRRSPEITPWDDRPFGTPPLKECEISFVVCVRAACTGASAEPKLVATATADVSATGSTTAAPLRHGVFIPQVLTAENVKPT